MPTIFPAIFFISIQFFTVLLFPQDPDLIILNDNVKDFSFLSKLEKDILLELNLARTSPEEYAKKLVETKKYYNGNDFEEPGQITIMTNEDIAAVNEAIRFLEETRSLKPLKISEGLSLAAEYMVQDQSENGGIGHTDSKGNDPSDRMNKFGKWKTASGENISYGMNTAEEIVMQLIIDDGVPDRGHRLNIFNKKFNIVGIAFGSHPDYGSMCVFDFAGGYQENVKK